MDKIRPLTKALMRAKTHRKDRPSNYHQGQQHDRPSFLQGHRRSSERVDNNSNDIDIEKLLQSLAKMIMDYALKRYLESDDNKRRKRDGASEIDFEVLESMGKKILEKVFDSKCNTDDEIERRYRRHRHKGNHYRHRRTESRDGSRYERHRRHNGNNNHHRRDWSRSPTYSHHRRHPHGDEHITSDHLPSVHVTPPSDSTSPPRKHHHRHECCHESSASSWARLPASFDLAPLQSALEDLSTTLVELNERPATPRGGEPHKCELYEKLTERTGPLQLAIGEVLGKIRESEEANLGKKYSSQRPSSRDRRRRVQEKGKTIAKEFLQAQIATEPESGEPSQKR